MTEFDTSSRAAYDLRSNSTALASEVPDLNEATPGAYTNDWDPNSTRVFKIVMNETENKVQVFFNDSTGDKVYAFDVDGNLSSGVIAGQEFDGT